MANDDDNTLRFPPLSAILGESAGQNNEPTDEPDTPKKHIRKQSRETKKTAFPPRKAPTLEEPKDVVKPKQTKSRNGISTRMHTHTHTHTLTLHIYVSTLRRFPLFFMHTFLTPIHIHTHAHHRPRALLIQVVNRMFNLQGEASKMWRGEARLSELCKERRDMWWIQEGVSMERVWQLRSQGEH